MLGLSLRPHRLASGDPTRRYVRHSRRVAPEQTLEVPARRQILALLSGSALPRDKLGAARGAMLKQNPRSVLGG